VPVVAESRLRFRLHGEPKYAVVLQPVISHQKAPQMGRPDDKQTSCDSDKGETMSLRICWCMSKALRIQGIIFEVHCSVKLLQYKIRIDGDQHYGILLVRAPPASLSPPTITVYCWTRRANTITPGF
jgi:hypothetical protein